MPVTFHLPMHRVSLGWRMIVDAAMWAFRVVEQDGLLYSCCYLSKADKYLSMKQLILNSAVDAFGHRIVLRVAALGHTGSNMAAYEHLDILGTGVLAAAIGVVDECLVKAFWQCVNGHS